MKYGFIGAGNMGSAIINGMLKSKRFKDIVAYDIQKEKVQAFHNKVKYLSFDALVKQADIIVLAVKPQMMEGVLEKLKDYDITKKLFISIAAGYSCGILKKLWIVKLYVQCQISMRFMVLPLLHYVKEKKQPKKI